MRMSRTSLVASLLSVALAAAVVAQDPTTDAFTQPGSVPAEESSFLNGSTPDGFNQDWQWRFQADALYLHRNNHWNDIPVITGPETFRPSSSQFDYKAGSRLSLGIMQDDFELDFVYSTINDWNTSLTGVLSHGLDFDGPVAYGAAVPGAQTSVDPGANPNFLTSGTYFAPINTAALTGAESNELEFLKPGAKFSQQYSSALQDFEINYKRRQQPGRFARFGFGYRNVQFNERGLTSLSGTFDTVDSATGLEAAPNNGLSNGSLVSGGLTAPTVAAPGPPTGFTENGTFGADELVFTSNIQASNQLNGAQVTGDFLFLESEYFELGAFGKVGVFHNNATGSITENYTEALNHPITTTTSGSGSGAITSTTKPYTYTRSINDTKQVASFLGQAGLTGRIFVRQNVRLFGSYEVLYLSGLAMAPDQMQGINTTVTSAASLDLRTHSSVFIHGGRIGLEILWP